MTPQPKFKIGDRVRLVLTHKAFSDMSGVISEVHVSGQDVAYFVKDGSGTLFVSENNLALDTEGEQS